PSEEQLFHPWDSSPSKELRQKAKLIRQYAKCPVTGEPVDYVCPVAGIPTHANEQAYLSDTYYHEHVKDKLRKVNVYEHDLRSGREFPEFDFPETIDPTLSPTINFLNWDMFFYTREFYSMDTEFQLAATTKMLSYPITIGAAIHEYSPYTIKHSGRLTYEGLKSLAALRYAWLPRQGHRPLTRESRPARVFVIGARGESVLPVHIWRQLSVLFPHANLQVVFIGPECLYNHRERRYMSLEQPETIRIDERLSLVYYTETFDKLHQSGDFFPYDPYLDAFFMFQPGLGAKETAGEWNATIEGLLESKCVVFSTAYHEQDMLQDWDWLQSNYGDKLDVLLTPGDNVFGSTRWEVNYVNTSEVYQVNQKIFGIRGKRYPAI
ncbi:hypothetical protein CANCADRAFT_18691, partial [Tortispora caseinolytica NRRL Y-17796]